jgi:hypothetical protein
MVGGFVINLTYNVLHITTGKRIESTFMSTKTNMTDAVAELLLFLNRCNSQNPGTWQYWY